MSDRPRLTVTLEPAAELEHRDLAQRVPGFEDAYGKLVGILSARPRRGWPLAGGSWGYALARRGKPRVRVIYTFNTPGYGSATSRRRRRNSCHQPVTGKPGKNRIERVAALRTAP